MQVCYLCFIICLWITNHIRRRSDYITRLVAPVIGPKKLETHTAAASAGTQKHEAKFE